MMSEAIRRARARLGRDGHEVVKAADPTVILGWTFALDLVLCDVMMLEARRLRARAADPPGLSTGPSSS